MKVLIACEESQTVCKAFRQKGHEAFSCDIKPATGGHPNWHYQVDVFEIINEGWDLMIAHPPCTYLTIAANKWLNDLPVRKSGILVGHERKLEREKAVHFILKLLQADIPKICIENPVGYLSTVYRKPDQIIHPYYFGDPTTKKTCLWLKNLPKLIWSDCNTLFEEKTTVEPIFYTTIGGRKISMWSQIEACKIRDREERSTFRSKTFPGIAAAMADQWG
jgi:hypothetical protein